MIIWGLFALLGFRSQKEQGRLSERVSIYIYKKLNTICWLRHFLNRHMELVQRTLISLYPGQSPANLVTEYYVTKIRIVLWILLAGSILSFCTVWVGNSETWLRDSGIVERKEESGEVLLEALIDGKMKENITLKVEERKLTEAEAEILCQELILELETIILGDNASLKEICSDLVLPEALDGYPFLIRWKSGNRDLVEDNGKVQAEDLQTEAEVWIYAEFSYGEWEYEHDWKLTLIPPSRTEREQLIYDLTRQSRRAEAETQHEVYFMLPTTVNGKSVVWREAKESGGELLLLTLAAAVAVFYMKDKDLQEQLAGKQFQMLQAYPIMVSKYALFLGAGMTVRGAFIKICKDYYDKGNSVTRHRKIHPLYEEMLYACNELQSGVSEGRVYENFGRRTGLKEYTRLCALLSQNLKKGNTDLVQRLKLECDEALRENIHLQKRQGEEAETKLLLPMVMMLLLVLVMILLPAFSGIGIA